MEGVDASVTTGPSTPSAPALNGGDDLTLPTFAVIGAPRAATRWLRANLAEHPDIYVAPRPIGYLADPQWRGGLRGYRLRFRDGRGHPVGGEVDAGYMRGHDDPWLVVRAITDRLPDLRLVAIVREPVDRLFSEFRDHLVHGRLPLDADLCELIRTGDRSVAELELVRSSRYRTTLYPFWRRFGDQLLVIVLDDIRTEPQKVYDRVLEHIGASPGFTPKRLEQVLYSNAHSKWTADVQLSDEQRRALGMLFRDDVEELEAMLGRFLPEWDLGPPPLGWEAMVGEP